MKQSQILVVDDDTEVRFLCRCILQSKGYGVVEAADGSDATDIIIKRNDIDLILADRQMPRRDGLELAKFVRGFHRTTPMILLTAKPPSAKEQPEFDRYFQGFLAKPFSADDLLRKLEEILVSKRAA